VIGPFDYQKNLVVGVGNADRGDDGIGLWVAARLRERNLPGLAVRELRGDPLRLLDAWANVDQVFVVDASFSGRMPGSVQRFDVTHKSLVAGNSRFSSHGAGVGNAVELGRALNRLPSRLVIIAIEGKDFRCGAAISPGVKKGARRAMELILRKLTISGQEPQACMNGR